jgi:hypothetical protein
MTTATLLPTTNTIKKLIYNPKLDDVPGSRPIRYCRPLSREKTARKGSQINSLEAVELVGTWIRPGINDISAEELDYIMSLPETSEKVRLGVFRVLSPENKEVFTDTISDYSLPDAREIIANTFDTDWLQLASTQDSRRDVQKWCLERIKVIKAKEAKRTA